MPIHPEIAERFRHLDGITSMREAYADPVLRERIQQIHTWAAAAPPPVSDSRADAAPGPHGPVPVRVYTPAGASLRLRPALVWFHGGGFVGGDLDMNEADWTAREICHRADAVVVSVDYRLAVNGVHYPVPHDDSVAAIRWVRDSAERLGIDVEHVWVGGASAGANLSTGAVLRLRDEDGWLPAGLIPVYGVFHPVLPAPSRGIARAIAELPAVSRGNRDDDTLERNYLGGAVSRADGYAMPGLALLDGLCPTVVVNAEYDVLRSSGEAFSAALALAGVDVRQVTAPGLIHAFLNMPATLEPVGRVLALMADLIRIPAPTV